MKENDKNTDKRLALVNSEDIRMIADNCKEIKSILSCSLDSHEESPVPIPDSCEIIRTSCEDMKSLLWLIVFLTAIQMLIVLFLGLSCLYCINDLCG